MVPCTVYSLIAMARKPVPLSRVAMANKAAAATAAAAECPPVTGLNGDYLPYSNSFDTSGAFRSRTGSGIKRARTESEMERDTLYVLSREYPPPPLICPDKPALDPVKIKSLWFPPPTSLALSNRSSNRMRPPPQ